MGHPGDGVPSGNSGGARLTLPADAAVIVQCDFGSKVIRERHVEDLQRDRQFVFLTPAGYTQSAGVAAGRNVPRNVDIHPDTLPLLPGNAVHLVGNVERLPESSFRTSGN